MTESVPEIATLQEIAVQIRWPDSAAKQLEPIGAVLTGITKGVRHNKVAFLPDGDEKSITIYILNQTEVTAAAVLKIANDAVASSKGTAQLHPDPEELFHTRDYSEEPTMSLSALGDLLRKFKGPLGDA